MTKKILLCFLGFMVLLSVWGCGKKEEPFQIREGESQYQTVLRCIDITEELDQGSIQGSVYVQTETDRSEGFVQTVFEKVKKGWEYAELTKETEGKSDSSTDASYFLTKQTEGNLYRWEEGENGHFSWITVSENSWNACGTFYLFAGIGLGEDEVREVQIEEEGELLHYTFTANDQYGERIRSVGHNQWEQYTVQSYQEEYWIDENGLIQRHKTEEWVQWIPRENGEMETRQTVYDMRLERLEEGPDIRRQADEWTEDYF